MHTVWPPVNPPTLPASVVTDQQSHRKSEVDIECVLPLGNNVRTPIRMGNDNLVFGDRDMKGILPQSYVQVSLLDQQHLIRGDMSGGESRHLLAVRESAGMHGIMLHSYT